MAQIAWHSGRYGGAGVDYAWIPNIIVGLQYTHGNIDRRVDGSVPFQGTDDRRVGGKIGVVESRISFKLWRGTIASRVGILIGHAASMMLGKSERKLL